MSRSESTKALALKFLLRNVGEVVTRAQIEAHVREVRGVQSAGEVTRRVRDLRREGWQIETSTHGGELRPGEYRLVSITRRHPLEEPEDRSLRSLLTEVLARPEDDLREIYEAIGRRLRSPVNRA